MHHGEYITFVFWGEWVFWILRISPSGLAFRVTLEDGTKWLVHKGDGYGISSQTVVVAARHMAANNWKASIFETLV